MQITGCELGLTISLQLPEDRGLEHVYIYTCCFLEQCASSYISSCVPKGFIKMIQLLYTCCAYVKFHLRFLSSLIIALSEFHLGPDISISECFVDFRPRFCSEINCRQASILVTAVTDFQRDGNRESMIVTHGVTSTDPFWDGYDPGDIQVREIKTQV